MARYDLIYLPSNTKDLRGLPRTEKLRDNAFPAGAMKLEGWANRYRLRQGDYRIPYSVDEVRVVVTVVKIGHRSDVYRQ